MAGTPTEFDLIARIRARALVRDDVLLGIGDDAAILRVPPGNDLVVSTDTLNVGVHFPAGTAPFDIGWKALAVNLSDLAAMGAGPAWCTLNLTLPDADGAWLDRFLDGFLDLATQHRVALVGGDTTRGPLSVSVTVLGLSPRGLELRRDSARPGDDVWVSGTLGDAAAALHQWREGSEPNAGLRERLDRPSPRIALGRSLRSIARAGIDVSDGLLADLGHVLDESGVGALIDTMSLPTSPELALAFDPKACIGFQLRGGDDYELCFTAPPARERDVLAAADSVGVAVSRIGQIEAEPGLRLRDASGQVGDVVAEGYRHFDPSRNAS